MKANMKNGIVIDEKYANSIDNLGRDYFAYHDAKARAMIKDPVQKRFFEDWLKGRVGSPAPSTMREAYDAIVYLCMVGCG